MRIRDRAAVVPNETADWINQRDVTYDQHLPLSGANGIFQIRSNGLQTNRDAWVYNSSSTELTENVERMVHHLSLIHISEPTRPY